MATITETDLLSELVREITLPPLLPDDVTSKRLEERTGMSNSACRRFLENKVAAGELMPVRCIGDNGHIVTAYRKAEG